VLLFPLHFLPFSEFDMARAYALKCGCAEYAGLRAFLRQENRKNAELGCGMVEKFNILDTRLSSNAGAPQARELQNLKGA
jgi:hypothetical protein